MEHAYVVSGLGRCGTRLLLKALVRAGLSKLPFLNRFEDRETLPGGHVIKTHDYPPERLPQHVKVVYLFGNPMNIAISAHTQINRWGRAHHGHLVSDRFRDNNQVLLEDTLQLRRHFRAWYRPQGFSMITVRYETLFEEATTFALARCLGIPLVLPPYQPRKADWTNHPLKKGLLGVYGELHETIRQAEDLKIWEPLDREVAESQ